MTKVEFTWDDAWAYYPTATPEAQKAILETLGDFLKTCSPKAQVKALESAPKPVIKACSNLLDNRAKKALGLEVTRKLEWHHYLLSGKPGK